MTAPLVILGVLALFAGLLNAHLLHLTWFEQWLNPVFARAGAGVTELERAATAGPIVLSLALAAFGAGAGAAYWVYLSRRGEPAQNLRERFPGLYALVYDKWRVDEFYDESIVWVTNAAADVSTWFDKWVVDGIVSRLTSGLVALAGAALRYVQVGRVQGYAATMMVGVVSIGWFVSTPQTAATTTSDHEAGRYVIAAAPGLGYRYRWDTLGDGSWDSEEFGDQRTTNFELKVDETRTVRLEVMNAFGRVGSEEYVLHRPKPDRSRGPTIIELGRDPSGALRGVPRPPRGAMPAPGRAPGQGGTP
jgi:NADH-quinone oxidoreductase subunit L